MIGVFQKKKLKARYNYFTVIVYDSGSDDAASHVLDRPLSHEHGVCERSTSGHSMGGTQCKKHLLLLIYRAELATVRNLDETTFFLIVKNIKIRCITTSRDLQVEKEVCDCNVARSYF